MEKYSIVKNSSKNKAMKLDILAIGVHPDDIELSCGGTLLCQIDRGKKVGILDLTKGELGTRGTAETRLKEAEKAADMMGVLIRKNIGLPDCFFENNKSSILKIIEVIRCHRPEII
jgi:LmbE family N-acetylglucosaminyl deacetylase